MQTPDPVATLTQKEAKADSSFLVFEAPQASATHSPRAARDAPRTLAPAMRPKRNLAATASAVRSTVAQDGTVFVVDDDPAVRKSVERLAGSLGLRVEAYATADEFLAAYDPQRPGCLLLDVRLPGMSGLDLQRKLREEGVGLPVIVITGYGAVPMAVQALKAGAVDFIEKPFEPPWLLERIQEALEQDARNRAREAAYASFTRRVARLTPRERQVMQLLVQGRRVKEIAGELGISHKTVQVHQMHIMDKMQLESVGQLVRLATLHQIG